MALQPDPPEQPVAPPAAAPGAPVPEAPVPEAPSPAAVVPGPVAPEAGRVGGHGRRLPRTRAGTAWVSIVSAALLLVLLVVFIAQNAHPVDVSFLMLHGRFPLAVALLAAVAGGALIAIIGGTLRMVQLRRAVPRRAPARTPEPGTEPGTAPAAFRKFRKDLPGR